MRATPVFALAFALAPLVAGAEESIEFVGEHLPEIAMDNRYASLPIWGKPGMTLTASFERTHSGTLSIDGPLLAAGWSFRLGERGKLTTFGFFDDLTLSGGIEDRPLDVVFATPPLALPAPAQFTGLDGRARDVGLGVAYGQPTHLRFLGGAEWTAGVLWQRVSLSNYSFDYRITGGPEAGTTGFLDYSADYTHLTPFAGLAWPGTHGQWDITPHLQIAAPTRRGFAGRITGPGFDLAGDQAANGAGKHFGDPSFTIGLNFTYLPWHLGLDLGTTLSQAVIEPHIHEGVRRDILVSARWFH